MFRASPHSSPLAIVIFCFAVSGCSSGGNDSGDKNDSGIKKGTNGNDGTSDQGTDSGIVQHGGCIIKGFGECTAQTDASSCNAANAACSFQFNSCIPDPGQCGNLTNAACEEASHCELNHTDRCLPVCERYPDPDTCHENDACSWNAHWCAYAGDCRTTRSTTKESCEVDPGCRLLDPVCYPRGIEAAELCAGLTVKDDCELQKDCKWVAFCEQRARACWGIASPEECGKWPECDIGLCENTCAKNRGRSACEADSNCEWVSVAYQATDAKAKCTTGCHR